MQLLSITITTGSETGSDSKEFDQAYQRFVKSRLDELYPNAEVEIEFKLTLRTWIHLEYDVEVMQMNTAQNREELLEQSHIEDLLHHRLWDEWCSASKEIHAKYGFVGSDSMQTS